VHIQAPLPVGHTPRLACTPGREGRACGLFAQNHGAALPPVPYIDFLPCFCAQDRCEKQENTIETMTEAAAAVEVAREEERSAAAAELARVNAEL
jgi:hypothetical protein